MIIEQLDNLMLFLFFSHITALLYSELLHLISLLVYTCSPMRDNFYPIINRYPAVHGALLFTNLVVFLIYQNQLGF